MPDTLAARLQDAGELRSERAGVGVVLPRPADLLRAAAVCAAVEAFQAAEQAYQSAWENWQGDKPHFEASKQLAAAKARLLEVNLG
jgi:hypothetical protein